MPPDFPRARLGCSAGSAEAAHSELHASGKRLDAAPAQAGSGTDVCSAAWLPCPAGRASLPCSVAGISDEPAAACSTDDALATAPTCSCLSKGVDAQVPTEATDVRLSLTASPGCGSIAAPAPGMAAGLPAAMVDIVAAAGFDNAACWSIGGMPATGAALVDGVSKGAVGLAHGAALRAAVTPGANLRGLARTPAMSPGKRKPVFRSAGCVCMGVGMEAVGAAVELPALCVLGTAGAAWDVDAAVDIPWPSIDNLSASWDAGSPAAAPRPDMSCAWHAREEPCTSAPWRRDATAGAPFVRAIPPECNVSST